MKEIKGVQVNGIVLEALPGLLFRVELDSDKEILAYLSGKMKMHYIRVIPGDKVVVELPSPDDKKGRIIRRL